MTAGRVAPAPDSPSLATLSFGPPENHLMLMSIPARVMTVHAAIVTAMALLLAAPLLAQGDTSAVLRGSVTDDAGRPIAGALVLLRLDAVTAEARTDTAGAYSVAGLRPGRWRVVVRQLGFIPDTSEVVFGSRPANHDVRLRRITQLDRRVISANWTGVTGVVGDRRYQRVPEATVTVVGERVVARIDGSGSFAIPWPGGLSILLRVQAPGYADRLVSARIPERGAVELSVLLDTAQFTGASALLALELDRRMDWASPMAANVSREELLRVGTTDAMMALSGTPSFNRKGLVIERDACVFVDGLPRPGLPLDAIDPATIEFIEVYPGGAERTGILASRWPRGGRCGAPVDPRFKRWVPGQQVARYVVVWTRQP